ncbi:hypothetical protein CI238_04886, partial [Colletotrichum incanum]
LPSTRRYRTVVFLQVLLGWVITLLFVLAIFALLHFYSEEMTIMTVGTKRQFNALVTGLSIALGFSVTRGLDKMVSLLRWWILSRRYYSRSKIEFILQAESLTQALLLATKTRSIRSHVAVLFWLILKLGFQVGLAMIGLCYSLEVAQHNALVLYAGSVLLPDMSELQMVNELQSKSVSHSAREYMANSYGQMSLSYKTATPDRLPVVGQLRDAGDPLMFCSVNDCRYTFYEWSEETSDDGAMRLTVATDRTLHSTATCESWPILGFSADRPGHISLDNGVSMPLDVFFPLPDGANQTTYLTNSSVSCGIGCRFISAVEVSERPTWYYNCTVAVSAVAQATAPEHEVSDSIRDLAAAGIALQGFQATSRLGDPSVQFQVYPAESTFGVPMEGFAQAMGMNLARFAIGVVAVTAETNSPITVNGTVPQQGLKLIVDHWNYASLILIMVAGLHLVLGLGAALVASRVVIPTGGPVALARVLRPLVNHVTTTKRQSATSPRSTDRWMYRSRVMPDGSYDLYMEEELRVN